MERAVPVLPADDLTVAKQFYVNGLGFDIRFEATDDGRRGLLGVQRGSMVITLDTEMTGHGRDACAALEVEDVDRYYEEWKDRISIDDIPKNEEWGARTFSVHDPSGNTLFVIGPLPTSR